MCICRRLKPVGLKNGNLPRQTAHECQVDVYEDLGSLPD